VLELTGRGSENAWFSYLSQVRRELPVIQKEQYVLADGTVCGQSGLSETERQMLSKLRCWSYYKLKYKSVK
jgi:hypothetical protein